MAHPSFGQFREVVLHDSEYYHRPGELYLPVNYAYRELHSGRADSLAGYELGPEPPHAHGPDVLMVSFTGAEAEFFCSIGWPLDSPLLDLRVVGIHQTNFAIPREDPDTKKKRPPPPRSLIQFLRANGIKDGNEAYKKAIRDRIIQGPPYTEKEHAGFKLYNADDIKLLGLLMDVLVPRIGNFRQMLEFGEYVKFCAEMFARGFPSDPWAAPLLRDIETRRALRLRAVSDTSLTHGLYQGPSLNQTMMREFLLRHREIKAWRTTRKGTLGTKHSDFEMLENLHPQFRGIADAHKTVKQLHELQLFPGADERFRAQIWPFSTITGRAAPDGSAYPFLLMPRPSTAMIYLDFSGMEFGVAAGLSQAPLMLADYHGEPYLKLPILAGWVPPSATKHTHRNEREAFKPMILAMQYGGGASLIAGRLGKTGTESQRLVDLHHDRYSGYWDWSDRQCQRAFDAGELVAPDGWRCGIDSRTNPFTVRNWLIQAYSAALFRYAGLLMRKLNLPVIAPVHDAYLLECNLADLARVKALAIECLERASRRFLHGLTLRVDPKVIMPGERFTDSRGKLTWDFVEQSLREMEEQRRHAG